MVDDDVLKRTGLLCERRFVDSDLRLDTDVLGIEVWGDIIYSFSMRKNKKKKAYKICFYGGFLFYTVEIKTEQLPMMSTTHRISLNQMAPTRRGAFPNMKTRYPFSPRFG